MVAAQFNSLDQQLASRAAAVATGTCSNHQNRAQQQVEVWLQTILWAVKCLYMPRAP
jgi:hypothetical protein